jgi:hypothetical protein
MDLRYIVANPEYWHSVPSTRQLTCGRVRFTNAPVPTTPEARGFALKADAMQYMLAQSSIQVLVRETKLDESSWHYQLLLPSRLT